MTGTSTDVIDINTHCARAIETITKHGMTSSLSYNNAMCLGFRQSIMIRDDLFGISEGIAEFADFCDIYLIRIFHKIGTGNDYPGVALWI